MIVGPDMRQGNATGMLLQENVQTIMQKCILENISYIEQRLLCLAQSTKTNAKQYKTQHVLNEERKKEYL